MPTYKASLTTTEYVKINTSLSPMLLQALRDEVRIAFSTVKPAKGNEIFHTLSGADAPLPVNAPDVDVWALAMTDRSSLVISELDPAIVESYETSIGRGKIINTRPEGSFGERSALSGEVNRVIWPNGVFSLPPAAGVQMSIVSTSANDTAAGTGIQSLELHYLHADLTEGHETVVLAGLTPVLTVATDIRFIQCMHISTYGTSAAAAGDITASNATVIHSQISQGDLRCTSSVRMVPAGMDLYLKGAIGSSVSGTSAAKAKLRIVASELDTHQYIDPLILIPFGTIGVQDASEAYNFPTPLKFSPGTVVGMTVSTDKDANVSGSWFGWLEGQ